MPCRFYLSGDGKDNAREGHWNTALGRVPIIGLTSIILQKDEGEARSRGA